MISLFFLRSALRPIGLLTVLLLGLTACESGPGGHRGPPPAEGGPSKEAAVPAMEARAVFFAGEVEAEIILNRTGFGPRGSNRGAPPRDGGVPGEGGSERGRGGRGRRGGPMGDGGAGGSVGARGDADGRVANIRASNEAPVSFHLRLTNRGPAPIVVEVPDFNSELGNFVVQPARINLPVNEAVEADPMISRLGLRSAEIPLTVRLRVNGKSESQVLTLRPSAPAASDLNQPEGAGPAPIPSVTTP